ncbi:brachyurin-like [Culex pipiens pallens]|uniref:brachyurin-like n=1 Tax=Culex pipiens pallens TaxID=42434 RepID=UPI001952D1C0|nr:brachyurin-like [Culex pipiens pallens]
MRKFFILFAAVAVANAKSIDIDSSKVQPIESIGIKWSQVQPVEDSDQFWARLPEEMQYLRKQQPDRRIVNGQEAAPGQFPYQAVLSFDTTEGGDMLCGGSILSSDLILTAAHCVWRATRGIAIVGAQNRNINEPTQQRIPFSKVFYHADYNEKQDFRNDIAIVRLSSQITFNDRVKTVRLPARGENRQFAGLTGTVSGFGRTCDDCDTSNVLRYTSNTVMSNADCRASSPNPAWIEDQNVCMSSDGDRSFCRGDSGGPLTVMDGGSTLQIGIVSFSRSDTCITPNVYARVTYYLDWILHVMTL